MREAYLTGIKVENSSFEGLKLIGSDSKNTWYADAYNL